MTNLATAKQRAKELLSSNERFPVDIYAKAKSLGIEIKERALEDAVSGMLLTKNDKRLIVVNSLHSETRQRFSIAHEIGHYKLHNLPSGVFVDADPIFFRDKSGAGAPKEIEANAFAAELLMPEVALRKFISEKSFEVFDEDVSKQIAEYFGVSIQAITVRLMKLELIHS